MRNLIIKNIYDQEKYINRVKSLFFDEDTNDILVPEQFIVSKSDKNVNIIFFIN